MYPKDKNHFSVKNIFSINSNKKAFRVKQTNFEKQTNCGENMEKLEDF